MPRVTATYQQTGLAIDPQTGAVISPEMGTGGTGLNYQFWTPTDPELSAIAKQAHPDAYEAFVAQYGSLPADTFEKMWTAESRNMWLNQQVTDPKTGMVSNQDQAWSQAAAPYEEQWRTTNNLAPAPGLPGAAIQLEDPTAFKSIMQPGVTIDPSAYGDTALEAADKQRQRDYAASIQARDANRFAVDPLASQQAASGRVGYNAVDATNAFNGARQGINSATAATNNVLTTGRQGMMNAGELARLAAEGKAPSAAEQMYAKAGEDAATAFRRNALDAQTFARQKGDALAAQQASLAASQRGAVAGLAGLQAMNNTALGQQQIYQQAIDAQSRSNLEAASAQKDAQFMAAAGRANEMASARELYLQAEQAMRDGDLAGAQQLAALAEQQARLETETLRNNQNNATQQLAADTTSLHEANVVNDANANRQADLTRGNQATALSASAADTQGTLQAMGQVTDANENARRARMQLEGDWGAQVHQNADRATNTLTGQQTVGLQRQQLDQQQEEAERRQAGSLVGAAGTVIAAAASDKRLKNVAGDAKPSDFRAADTASLAKRLTSKAPTGDFRQAKDSVYTYKGDPSQTVYKGPMAQQLPANVQTRGPGGMRYVDTSRLAMNLASAVGRLQKKVGV